jgi:hypothetical protein
MLYSIDVGIEIEANNETEAEKKLIGFLECESDIKNYIILSTGPSDIDA